VVSSSPLGIIIVEARSVVHIIVLSLGSFCLGFGFLSWFGLGQKLSSPLMSRDWTKVRYDLTHDAWKDTT